MADHCRSCGAPVFRLKHERTQKFGIIDMEPVDNGNIVIDLDEQEYAVVKPEHGKMRYRSHFVTCPDREEWKKK